MADFGTNSTLSANQFYAEGVLNDIRSFVTEFESRGELNALRQIIEGGQDFKGGLVGQMPERFTEQHLIRPVLETLGYSDIVSEPADLVTDQRTIPDFQVNSGDPACVCIVEAKRLGRLNDVPAEESIAGHQVSQYLGENALAKYKRDLDVQYLIGIGTDGITWLLYAKSIDTGEQIAVQSVSLHETFKQAVLAQQFEDTIEDDWVTTHRTQLEEEFVPAFVSNAVGNTVSEIF